MALPGVRGVTPLVAWVGALDQGLPAAGANLGLLHHQGDRPRPVLVGPQRLTGFDDTAEEDGARDTPGAGCFYFVSVFWRVAEARAEKGTDLPPVLASHAALNSWSI